MCKILTINDNGKVISVVRKFKLSKHHYDSMTINNKDFRFRRLSDPGDTYYDSDVDYYFNGVKVNTSKIKCGSIYGYNSDNFDIFDIIELAIRYKYNKIQLFGDRVFFFGDDSFMSTNINDLKFALSQGFSGDAGELNEYDHNDASNPYIFAGDILNNCFYDIITDYVLNCRIIRTLKSNWVNDVEIMLDTVRLDNGDVVKIA